VFRGVLLAFVLVTGSLTGVTPTLSVAQPEGGITRLDITRVESPTFGGKSFGSVGQYEKLVGRAYGEVDPNDPRNSVITDLSLAPRNADGMVEYATDVLIIKPINLAQGNHRLSPRSCAAGR
jgi:hypothetical protein